jgi:hypothetical protein
MSVFLSSRKYPNGRFNFDGNFWGHHGRDRACKDISLDKQFVWGNEVCHVPAIYTCSKGLVIDFCLQVPAERIRSFMDKWNLSVENGEAGFSDGQLIQIGAENPLTSNINPKVVLNGTTLSSIRGCGISWNPCIPEDNSLEARSAIQHYELDPAKGYAIWRSVFPWKRKRKPQIKALSVTLIQKPVAVPGSHFRVAVPGERIEFIHPATGVKHTLTVQEYERQEISLEHLADQNQEFPTHYTVMSYTLSPDLPDGAFTVTDCARSDQPRQKHTVPNKPHAVSSVCVGVIGGADGATAIIFGGSGQGKLHTACSSLHFEPAEEVEWCMVFYEKRRDDITVELI